jgi:hypothetical protein
VKLKKIILNKNQRNKKIFEESLKMIMKKRKKKRKTLKKDFEEIFASFHGKMASHQCSSF